MRGPQRSLLPLGVPVWGWRADLRPLPPGGPSSGSLLSPQRVCLQADGRGLLHPLRILAGRDFVEEVGGFPSVWWWRRVWVLIDTLGGG